MSGRVSPFEALTGVDKQIRWLEVQSVRLPYVRGAMEKPIPEQGIDYMERTGEPTERAVERRAVPAAEAPPKPATQEKPAMQERPAMRGSALQADFQRTRHRQYDAVIARMKQAEQRISGYKPLS